MHVCVCVSILNFEKNNTKNTKKNKTFSTIIIKKQSDTRWTQKQNVLTIKFAHILLNMNVNIKCKAKKKTKNCYTPYPDKF